MGGRYGGTDDGSDEYQDRRPTDDEQQTVADAVQAVAERHRSDDGESSSGRDTDGGRTDGRESETGDNGSGQHPLTSLRTGRSTSGSTTLQDVDQKIAEYVADELTESVRWAVEEADPDKVSE